MPGILIQHHVIKLVNHLCQVFCFFRGIW